MSLATGTRLDSYEIVAPLGAGGMGEVYRARDSKLKRDVAIKVLPDFWSRDPERLRRFELEAQAAATLNHPNIVSIFHVGQYNGSPYIVTELLQGESLRERLRHGPMRVREAIAAGIEIAQGLAAAHDAGIIHRDLKPENIFLTKNGRTKVLDFGLAKLNPTKSATADDPTVTQQPQSNSGHVLGTVGYMSPEQVRGQPADTRSDIFAVGAVLYEMLTGKQAFRKATSAETMSAILNEDPQPVSQIAPSVPPGLQRIVHRCLTKNADHRIQHATDLAFALEALSDSTSASLPARKGRTLWVAAGVVAFIAVIVIGAFFWQSRHRAVSTVSSAIPRAIAVLPFQNVGTDKNTDFLRLALPDEITTTLSYVPSLSIRPFATTSKYNGPNLDLQQAGREMGVTSIVTGHYLTEDDRLEVTLEAVDVANNRSVWRDTINVAAPDKIAMREQVTSKVRQGLVPVLGGLSAGDQGTRPKSEEAYDLYLRSVGVPHDVSPNKAAIAMLERAVGIDPFYAPAWEALGTRYYFEADYGEGGQAMLKRSDEANERALALDPNLIGASLQLITNRTERGELRNVYAEALALIKRRPDSAYAHFALAYVLRYAGLLDESARECDTALALDRSDYSFRSCSLTFMQLGQPERAMEFVRLDAGSQFAARQTALILLGQGKVDEARQTIQRTSDTPLMGRDLLQACLDPKQASQLDGAAQRMEAASVAEGDVEGWYIDGVMLSYCGQKDAALRLLKRAVGQNYCAYDALQTDPLLLKLRRTPQFTELLSAAKHCQNTFLVQRNQSPH